MTKILLIEDNIDILENTSEILELAGYEVETAENGMRGVEKAKANDFDLIICDIMMPELDGYGVLHILSKDPKTSLVPFIFLTAKSETIDFRKGMSLGADDYLTKPFEKTDLMDAIEMRLDKTRKLQSKGSTGGKEQVDNFIKEVEKELSLEDLINDRNTKSFKKKDIVYRQGEYPHALLYIKSGTIKLSRNNEYGKEFIVQLSGEGEFLGYLALLENGPYTEDAVAMEDAEIAMISVEDFRKLMHSNREVTNSFIRILSKNVLEHEQRLLKLAYGNVRERVAGVIHNLYQRYGEDNDRIGLNISREELAGYAGIATESLIRTLSDLRSDKIIGNDGKHITVTNPARLKSIAEGGI
ncbi:response regulator [Halocola ammonii]